MPRIHLAGVVACALASSPNRALAGGPEASAPQPTGTPEFVETEAVDAKAAPAQEIEATSTGTEQRGQRDPLWVASDLAAANELTAAIMVLDAAIDAAPLRAELFRLRADVRQQRVERRGSLDALRRGLYKHDAAVAEALFNSADDLQKFEELSPELSAAERSAVRTRARELRTVAAANRGDTARGTDEELEAIRRRRFRLRVTGSVLAGSGATAALVGISLAGASAQFFSTSPQCVVACTIGGQLNGPRLAAAGVTSVLGAGLTGVGLAIFTRNPRLIRADHERPLYAWERAVGRNNATRTAGAALLVASAGVAVAGAATAVFAARSYATATFVMQADRTTIDSVTRAANSAGSLVAAAPLLAAVGAGLRASVAPPAPDRAPQAHFFPVPGGIGLVGRF